MLFSEPKIPQSGCDPHAQVLFADFSALQRAENSSIPDVARFAVVMDDFSALQRAENSSILYCKKQSPLTLKFQCSSASRKFLNGIRRPESGRGDRISVLFSEPKNPQSPNLHAISVLPEISVLFSEPKIPQSGIAPRLWSVSLVFQCSSASRKFLNVDCCSR